MPCGAASNRTTVARLKTSIARWQPTATTSGPWFTRLSKACRSKRGEVKMLPEGYDDVHHTPLAATTDLPARDGHRRCAAVPRRHDSCACEGADRQSARAHGIRVRAEWYGHAALEPELRGKARRSSSDASAACAAQR